MATDGSGVAQPYIVMEYVAGRTLRDILREGRKILPERALEITCGVLSALDYSHRAGIIHRDIKPGNVMLTPSGDVKVMDFGIARAISDASSTMTQTAAVVGTAQYLSPEQARGETVDSRSDVYSAGCLLYELLTGRPPFVGDSPVAVAYQHVREPAAPPSDHDTELPPEIDAIVMKALAKRRRGPLPERRRDAQPTSSATSPAARSRRPPSSRRRPTAVRRRRARRRDHHRRPRPPRPPPTTRTSRGRSRTGCWSCSALLVVGPDRRCRTCCTTCCSRTPPEQEQVPDLIGMTEDEARAAIGDAGLDGRRRSTREADRDVARDEVIEQDPNRDQYVDPGTSVDLVVSTGKPMVEVPSSSGRPQGRPAHQLRDAKPRGDASRSEESDEPKGQVVETDPAGRHSGAPRAPRSRSSSPTGPRRSRTSSA